MSKLQTIQKHQESLKIAYAKYQNRKRLILIILAPILILSIFSSIGVGSADISLKNVFSVIFNKIAMEASSVTSHADIIIWKLRLPRVLMGVLSGIALGTSGAVMQVVLRNPLADPYILGISSAAGFGASLAIIFGVGIVTGPYLIIGNAFLFSMVSAITILAISGRKGASPQAMILTGLALLFFFQAMTTILQYFGESEAVKAAVFWTIGDLGKAGWDKLAITAPLVLIGTIILCWQSRDLNIINSGDATATTLGINVAKTRIITMIVSSLMVAGIVSFTGTIGFIGLVAPHIMRFIIGNDNKILMPASGLLGAILLTISDTIARTILSPVILPVGTVTAFLGVPLFIYLIATKSETML